MLQPVRTKWRKAHKGRIHGTASRANFINYGAYALKALTPDRVTGKQIFQVSGNTKNHQLLHASSHGKKENKQKMVFPGSPHSNAEDNERHQRTKTNESNHIARRA